MFQSTTTLPAFIVLELGAKACADLKTSLAAYQPHLPPEITRFILPSNYHVTLAFLGQIERELILPLSQHLFEMAKAIRSFRLCLTELDYFPNSRHPAVLAAMIYPAPELMDLYQAVNLVLKNMDIHPISYDQFRPHVSIAYCKNIPHSPPKMLNMPLDIDSRIHGLCVYESHTETGAARYEKIIEVEFIPL